MLTRSGQLPSQQVSAGCLVNLSYIQAGSAAPTNGLCQLLGQPPTAIYKLGQLPSQPVSAGCLVSLSQLHTSWVGCPHNRPLPVAWCSLPQLHTSWVSCPHNRPLPVAWSTSHSYIQAGSAALTTSFCRLLGQPFTATYKLGRLPSQPASAGCLVQPPTATYKLGQLPSQPVSCWCE